MQLNAMFPTRDIGSDPAKIRDWAQAAEDLGFDEDDYELENIADELSGTGVLSDEAINNISRRVQKSTGFGGQFVLTEDLFGRSNQFIGGYQELLGFVRERMLR